LGANEEDGNNLALYSKEQQLSEVKKKKEQMLLG